MYEVPDAKDEPDEPEIDLPHDEVFDLDEGEPSSNPETASTDGAAEFDEETDETDDGAEIEGREDREDWVDGGVRVEVELGV